jgi:hypothetical protein
MYGKQRHPVNLNQYRKLCGKWQFEPVARRDAKGNPDPALSLIDFQTRPTKTCHASGI